MILTAAGATVAAALVGWRVAASPTSGNAEVVGGVGGFGFALLLLATLRFLPDVLPWALGALAASYALGMPSGAGDVTQAAVFGVGLLITAELAYWSYEELTPVHGEAGTRRARIVLLISAVAATIVVDAVALGAAGLSAGGDLLLVAATMSVVLVAGLVAALVRAVRGS